MTPRKPKPRKPAPRKAAVPTLEQRVADLEAWEQLNARSIRAQCQRLDAIEARSRYRDASHDAPVSNASEAVGQSAHVSHVLHTPEEIDAWFAAIDRERRPWWRRFLDHMGAA